MTARAIMLQGTGSSVGKSTLVAGLCRAARRRGLRVAPFKPQNMSNNAAVCPGGGEIGRAQALQAQAAGVVPHPDLNPVLLKPQSDRSSQVIVHGRAAGHLRTMDFGARRDLLLNAILASFDRLRSAYDLVIVEGAGSAAEVNLRAGDVANMGFAEATDIPVVLVGDIDRGGVIAALVGTQVVLSEADAGRIVGYLINRFRGDPRLFDQGLEAIGRVTGWPCFGVVPWFAGAAGLPQEDATSLEQPEASRGTPSATIRIAAPVTSRIANFDDLDPLAAEPRVSVQFIVPGQPIPRQVDVIALLGSKATAADLAVLRAQGWHHDLYAHVRTGGRVIGICGGFQMLGRSLDDPLGHDGTPGSFSGLGLLAVTTAMQAEKTVRPAQGYAPAYGAAVAGYEIHTGDSHGPDCARPMLHLDGRGDGAVSPDGRIAGTYLHGLFNSDAFRHAWLEDIRAGAGSTHCHTAHVEAILEALASHIEAHADIETLLDLAH